MSNKNHFGNLCPPLVKTSNQNFSGDFGEIKTAREKLRAKRAKKIGFWAIYKGKSLKSGCKK